MQIKGIAMYPAVNEYLDQVCKEFDQIPAQRKQVLKNLAAYVRQKQQAGKIVQLNFICTHNSRRSQLSQIWAQVAAAYFGVDDVFTYSGGTEATAFHSNAVEALKATGLQIRKKEESDNPIYEVWYTQNLPPMRAWSKVFSDKANPQNEFCAVMTCTHADENCPLVPGAELRITTPTEDPKAYDDTPLQRQKYEERCRQIAREMTYAFSMVKESFINEEY
jgi:arsenate reductase (thioredoxin)